MGTVEDKIRALKKRRAQVLAMGGDKAVAKHKEKGKLTARERLDLLFDKDTFREVDMFVKHRCVNFGMETIAIAADGVVTGYGRVAGRPVFAFSQDFTSRAGSLGRCTPKRSARSWTWPSRPARRWWGSTIPAGPGSRKGWTRCPATGEIFYRNSNASGVIPQISAIMGPHAGGAVYSPAMTDFVFMVKNTSHMFITGPGGDQVRDRRGNELRGRWGGRRPTTKKAGWPISPAMRMRTPWSDS